MNKNAVTHKSKTGVIAAVAIVLTILLCAVAGRAFAQTGHYVDGWEDTGVSNAYLSNLDVDDYSFKINDSRIKYLTRDDSDIVFYLNKDLSKGEKLNIPNALTLTAKKAAYTVDGDYLDMTVNLGVTFTTTMGKPASPVSCAYTTAGRGCGSTKPMLT